MTRFDTTEPIHRAVETPRNRNFTALCFDTPRLFEVWELWSHFDANVTCPACKEAMSKRESHS